MGIDHILYTYIFHIFFLPAPFHSLYLSYFVVTFICCNFYFYVCSYTSEAALLMVQSILL